jgi:prevent-host-death family protein
MEVGVRELKNNLSRYLAKVSEGTEVTVTDRGRAVARITPVRGSTIDRLIAEGVVTTAAATKGPAPRTRIRAKHPVSPLVAEERR